MTLMAERPAGQTIAPDDAGALVATAVGVHPVDDNCFFFVLPDGRELRYVVESVSTGYCDTCAGHDTEITWTLFSAEDAERFELGRYS